MTECRYFNGYKPCGKSEICDALCPKLSVPSTRILLVHLEALGAVVRSTALLPAIRRKFPGCHLTWVTQEPAHQLLAGHPMIDRVLTTSRDDLLSLSALEFDVALVVDKGQKAAGVLKHTRAESVYGFEVDPKTGAVLPATEAARELWQIGLSDHVKFHVNRKPETQLAHEALELGPWMRDEYSLQLSEAEAAEARLRRAQWSDDGELVIGLNTGCSQVMPHKKLTIEAHRELIGRLGERPATANLRVVLLGGREDTLRNQRIAGGLDVIQSPTEKGLRDGMISVAACDIVVTGDSLGLHLAVAFAKWTVAWFGPTCAHEIDLYGRGRAVGTQASCSPCWKRTCDKSPMCYDMVRIDELVAAVEHGVSVLTRDEPSRLESDRRTTVNTRSKSGEQDGFENHHERESEAQP